MYQAHNIFNDRINPVADEDKVPQRSTPIVKIKIEEKQVMRNFRIHDDVYLTKTEAKD